jgi:hypothetical protein
MANPRSDRPNHDREGTMRHAGNHTFPQKYFCWHPPICAGKVQIHKGIRFTTPVTATATTGPRRSNSWTGVRYRHANNTRLDDRTFFMGSGRLEKKEIEVIEITE